MKKLILVANVSKEHIRKFYMPFIKTLKDNGWAVDVACRMDVAIPECDHTYDLPCDRNPFRSSIAKSVRILKGILRKNNYDLLVCSTAVGSIVARLAGAGFRKNGLKVVYLCHGLHFFPGAPARRWLMGYPIEKLLAPKTDAVVVTNDTDLETAKKYLPIPVIEKSHSMGVDLSRFREGTLTEAEREEQRRALGIAQDDFVLTYVAEIIDNKNQMMLVRAVESLRTAIPNIKLLLIGPEHDGGSLRKFVQASGMQEQVLLLGWRNDIPALLHLSDIYVASSKSEGLGLNLIEAMACGLPVIASKNRGHLEIVNHETNGFLVEQSDSKTMADYVLKLHSSAELRNAITKQAQCDITKYETTAAVKELYEMIIRYL